MQQAFSWGFFLSSQIRRDAAVSSLRERFSVGNGKRGLTSNGGASAGGASAGGANPNDGGANASGDGANAGASASGGGPSGPPRA
jgi:hypothetical protein